MVKEAITIRGRATRAATERLPEAMTTPISSDTLTRMDAWWRAANYLSVGQIYLLANISISVVVDHVFEIYQPSEPEQKLIEGARRLLAHKHIIVCLPSTASS